MKRFLFLLLILLMVLDIAYARDTSEESSAPTPPKLKFKIEQNPDLFSSNSEGEIILTISVPQRYHIYGGKELSVEVNSPNLKVQEIIYPKPQIEEDFPVYRGDVKVKIKTKLIDEKSAFQGAINVKWQGCQDFGDKVCFMPTTTKVPFDLKIQAAKKEESKEQNETDAISSNVNSSAVGEKTSKFSIFNSFSEKGRFVGFKSSKDFKNWYEGSKAGEEKEKENLFSKVAKENLFLAIVVAFFFGFLSSLTPCVYPIIPITIAYIGSKSQGKGKLSGFLLSLFFVVGLAVVYSSFGVASSLLGVSFGSLTQKPIVGISIAIIFALLGFSMLGLFEIAMPSKFASKIEEGKKKGKGYLGAFLIGALSGLVASPCIGPLLLAILVIVASLGSAVLGFLYLFSFALGMGVLFIIIGTFSGILSSLPKSGSWMDFVKILFGALIFGGSFYFASLYMSPKYFFLYCGLLIGFLISFLFFGANRHFFPVAFRIAGSILIVLCFVIVLILTPVKENDISQEYLFEKDLFEAANKSLKENKPLLIDFRADWCVACVELEKKTWPSDEAKEVFAEIVPAKVDFTVETAETKELTKIFKINGLPTVVLLYPQKADSSNED